MRDGWTRARLGELLTQAHRPVAVSGLTAVPFAGVRWYAEGVYPRAVEPAGSVKTKTLNRLATGDVTYNRMWATRASFGIAKEDVDGCLVTNDFPIFQADPDKVSVEFIGLIFRSRAFQELAATSATGTTERKRLKERDFLRLEIDLPSLTEQRRIVDLMAALDDAIESGDQASRSAVAVLDAYRDSLHAPTVKTLGDVARMRSGPSWKAADESPIPGSGWSPVLGITNTTSAGAIDLSTVRYVRGLPDSAMRLTENSIVMIRTNGNRNRIGNVYRADSRVRDFSVSAFQIAIEPHSPEDSDLIFHALAAPRFQRAASDAASGTTGLGNVAIGWLKQVEIPWPAQEGARAFTETCAALVEQIEHQRQAQSSLRILRSELLTSLLSGAHGIPDSYDATMDREFEGALA